MSRRAAARRYEISKSVAIKWLERVERDGSREPVGHGGHRAAKLMRRRDFLEAARAEKSDVTLQALCDRLSVERGVKADTSMMSRFFRRIGVTVKKRPLSHASRIARTSVATANDGEPIRGSSTLGGWSSSMKPGPKTNMTRLRGWAPRGERLVDKVPQGKGKTATFLAALRNDRIDAPCLFDGPINGARFHAYVEQVLAPTLKPGDVVILDNLGSHKAKAVRRTIRNVGARLVFLPKYSPTSIRSSRSSPSSKPCPERREREVYEAISDACGEILAQYPPAQCAPDLKNTGYAYTQMQVALGSKLNQGIE